MYQDNLAKAAEWTDKQKNLRAELTDRTKKLTLDDYDYQVWALEQEYIEYEKIAKGKIELEKLVAKAKRLAMAELAEEEDTFYQQHKAMIDNWKSSFTNTIVDGLMQGKMAFKDFARSVMRDLARIGIAKLITNPIATALGFTAKAAGGTVSAGSPYIVGEKGPELFMPGKSGTIIPNHNLKSGGAPPVTVNVVNNTGQQAEVRQEAPQFDGREWVVNVVMEAMATNRGGLRTALVGA